MLLDPLHESYKRVIRKNPDAKQNEQATYIRVVMFTVVVKKLFRQAY
jgi:hypothetical protein